MPFLCSTVSTAGDRDAPGQLPLSLHDISLSTLKKSVTVRWCEHTVSHAIEFTPCTMHLRCKGARIQKKMQAKFYIESAPPQVIRAIHLIHLGCKGLANVHLHMHRRCTTPHVSLPLHLIHRRCKGVSGVSGERSAMGCNPNNVEVKQVDWRSFQMHQRTGEALKWCGGRGCIARITCGAQPPHAAPF